MSRFQADFSTYPLAIYAPANVRFDNRSTVGNPINDNFTQAIDSDGNEVDLFDIDIENVNVTAIDRYEWEFGDGNISVEENPSNIYQNTNLYPVKLTIYSAEIYHETLNIFFRIKNSFTKEVDVGSVSVAWLKQHMTTPHLVAMETSQGFNDLVSSTGKMFDRMYKEIGETLNLIDIKKVAPKFLEIFSNTLGHQNFYAKKVGYSAQQNSLYPDEFLDYDIFDRISRNVATDEELNIFRNFILNTAKLFKENGSEHALESFFKLYGFVIDIKEMWTTNFGTTPYPAITDNFLNNIPLQDSQNTFAFKEISVSGFNNSAANISSNLSNLILDNFHYSTKHVYPTDNISEDSCEAKFEINETSPNIIKIIREDGRSISNISTCGSFSTPVCPVHDGEACTDSGAMIVANEEWPGIGKITSGTNVKMWRVRDNYVSSLINIYGRLPSGDDEIDENPINNTDDYLWANWKSGILHAPDIPGYTDINFFKPSDQFILPLINSSTSDTNNKLFSTSLTKVDSSRDLFVVCRGFIKVTTQGYYNFFVDIGNDGDDSDNNHIALFSLKHTVSYTEDQLNEYDSLNDFTFIRASGDLSYTVTDGDVSRSIYGKAGEYGLIELRQNEYQDSEFNDYSQDSGFYLLSPGYYAYELKTTYNVLATKKLKLYWKIWNEVIREAGTFFEAVQPKTIIPSTALITLDEFSKDIEDSIGKGHLIMPSSILEGGDAIKVVYFNSHNTNNNLSGFISTDYKYKDLDIEIRISPVSISNTDSIINVNIPKKTFGILFRGYNSGKDLYATVDSYYAFIMNGYTGEYSLINAEYNDEIETTYFRYLNLNTESSDLDKRIFYKNIVDELDHQLEMEDDTYYDFKLVVTDNKVSVYYRPNSIFTEAVDKIRKSISIDLKTYDFASESWQLLLENIDLLQDDVQTETLDFDKNILDIPQKYEPITEKGYYGFFSVDSIFKINRFITQSKDNDDYNRLTTIDKWKNIKPQYQENRSSDVLYYNSYGINDSSKPTNTEFQTRVKDDYAGETIIELPSYLNSITNNNVNEIFTDNVVVSSDGSRLNLLFNEDFINERFSSINDVLDSIVIPIGKFYEPFVEWSESIGQYSQNPFITVNQYISESAKIRPHTIAALRENDDLVIEYISSITRDEDENTKLLLETTLNTLIKATNTGTFNGVFEEVLPYSANETITVPTLGIVENPVFTIINRNSEKIGVQINNTQAFTKLQCRYCEHAIIYGLYELTLPETSIEIDGSYVNTIEYFIPIGKLDSSNMTFMPPAAILSSNIGINLIGVYAHLDSSHFTSADTTNNICFIIDSLNTFEIQYKSKVKCTYHIDYDIPLIAKITKYNNAVIKQNIPEECNSGNYLYRDSSNTECTNFVSNAYFLPDELQNIVKYFEVLYPVMENNVIDDEFENQFNWWMPTNIWLRRKTTPLYPNNSNNILFTGYSDIGESFYGQTIDSAGIKLSLDDDFNADLGTYIVDGEWCVSSSSWDSTYFDVNGITGTFNIIEIGDTMSAPISLELVTEQNKEYLMFGNYYNIETIGKRTFSPVGSFNWFHTHSDGISGSEMVGWDVTDWNQQFINCFKVKNVYYKITDPVFEMNKYWAFYDTSIPPIGSQINIIYSNRNCYEIDGDNTPDAIEQTITLGSSDGYQGFFSIPVILENYINWIKQINSVNVNYYTIDKDQYNVDNGNILLYTDKYSFNKFIGSDISMSLYIDPSLSESTTTSLYDDFYNNREINWMTCVDNSKYYVVGTRSVDTELKYTGSSFPYNITQYKNSNVYQALDKFDNTTIKEFAGSNDTSIDSKTVGFTNNVGFRNIMELITTESNNYSISCDFIFDKTITTYPYSRNFELILNANSKFIPVANEWGITDFYYVGTGTNGFDVGLGMRSYDINGNIVNDTFLVSFGDYNMRNVVSDKWYSIKADVSTENIKIYFNEKGDGEKLIINYNINKKYEKLTERYLKGEYETLQSILIGLEELTITYPDKLSSKVSQDFTFDKFSEEFASTLPINGQYCGFRVFNDKTYISNVKYSSNVSKKYTYGSAFDVVAFNDLLYKIQSGFTLETDVEIRNVDSTLNGMLLILIDDDLFYQFDTSYPEKYPNKVDSFKVVNDKIIIVEKKLLSDSGIGINRFTVGDNTFTWSIEAGTNNYGVVQYKQLLQTIPNASKITINRTFETGNIVTREVGYVSGTSGEITGSNSVITVNDEVIVTISGDRVINWPLNGTWARYSLFVRAYHEGFTKEYPILIKDKTFYTDSLTEYLDISNKIISNVYINDNRLNIIFEDII